MSDPYYVVASYALFPLIIILYVFTTVTLATVTTNMEYPAPSIAMGLYLAVLLRDFAG